MATPNPLAALFNNPPIRSVNDPNDVNALFDTQSVNPDKYAQELAMTERLRLPKPMSGSLEEKRTRAAYRDMLADFSVTGSWAKNREHALLVGDDDIYNLTGLEKQFKDISNQYESSWASQKLANVVMRAIRSGNQLSPEQITEAKRLEAMAGSTKSLGTVLGAAANALPFMMNAAAISLRDYGYLYSGGTVLGAATANPAGAALGLGLGGRAAFFKANEDIMAAQSYWDMMRDGGDHQTALRVSKLVGTFNAGVETLNVPLVGKLLPKSIQETIGMEASKFIPKSWTRAVAKKLTDVGLVTISSGAEEDIQTYAEEIGKHIYDKIAKGEEVDLREIITEVIPDATPSAINAMIEGMKAGLVFGSAGAIAQTPAMVRDIKYANHTKSFLKELSKTAKEGKVAGRSPSAMKEYAKALKEKYGLVSEVTIDANRLNQIIEDDPKVGKFLEEKVPYVMKELEEAVALGSEVAIKVEDYITYIAGAELNSDLVQDIRLNPAEPTIREVEEAQELAAENAEKLNESVDNQDEGSSEVLKSANQVFDRVYDEQIGLGRSEPEAQASAEYWKSWTISETKAQGNKELPYEFYTKLNIKVRRDPIDDMVNDIFDSPDSEDIKVVVEQLKKDDIPLTRRNRKQIREAISKIISGESENVLKQESTSEQAHKTAQKNASLPVSEGGLGLPANNTAMDRAKAMGFDVDTTYYHGTGDDIAAFDPKKAQSRDYGFIGEGHYVTSVKQVGNFYAESSQRMDESKSPNVIPLYVLGTYVGKYKELTVSDKIDLYDQALANPRFAKEYTKELKGQGYDGARVTDASGAVVDMVIFDPKNIRSINAAFNPQFSESSNLLSQDARGYVEFPNDRSYYKVTLAGKANASTFIHESSHIFLDVFRESILKGNASEERIAQGKTLLDWWGIESWEEMTVEHQERFAEGFENNLQTGKAPSKGLETAFATFKTWLTVVYNGFKTLKLPLTKEVRGVMDRMIAVDGYIDSISQSSLFEGSKPEFMTDKEYQSYLAKAAEVVESAKAQLLARAIKDIRDQKTQEWKDEEAGIEEEVTNETNNDKTFIVKEFLRRGVMINGQALPEGVSKINTKILESVYGKDIKNKLMGMYDANGVDPEIIAMEFGFDSGAEMVKALIETGGYKAHIKKVTDERMAELKPDFLSTPEALEEAQMAIRNVSKEEILALEIKALNKITGGTTTAKMIKDSMKIRADNMTVDDLNRPAKYLRGQQKAQEEAQQAFIDKDNLAAREAKIRELANFYMYRAAVDGKNESKGLVKYLKTFTKTKRREQLGKGGAEFVNAMDNLLEKVELKTLTKVQTEQRESLREWVASQLEQDSTAIISDSLLQETNVKNYKEMTLKELREVRDAAENIWTLSKQKRDIHIDGDIYTIESLREKFASLTNGVKPIFSGKDKLLNREGKDKARARGRAIGAEWTKIEFMMRHLDGDKIAGFWSRVLFQPFVDAQARSNDLMMKITGKFRDIIKNMPKEQKKSWNEKVYVEALGATLRRKDIIVLALNAGNEGNLKRLLDGHQVNKSQVVDIINEKLSKEDMDIVQQIWDIMSELYPLIEETTVKATGLKPNKVDATQLMTRWGTYTGGYFPIVYDYTTTPRVIKSTDDGWGNDNILNPKVDNSVTKDRAKEVLGRKLMLSMDVIPQQINKQIHFISHYEAVRQANRLIADKEIAKLIRDKLSDEFYLELKPWLTSIAKDETVTQDGGWAEALQYLRTSVQIVHLGYSLTTGYMQTAGLSLGQKELGIYNQVGMKEYLKSPFVTTKFANDSSEEMSQMLQFFDRDIRSATKSLVGKQGLLNDFRRWSFLHIGYIQKQVNIITWTGAYKKRLKETGSHEEAVIYSDAVVRQTQSTGAVKDLAAIQRGTEAKKNFTMFYTYFSLQANQLMFEGGKLKRDGVKQVPSFIRSMLFIITVPAIMNLMRSGVDGDEPLDYAKALAAEQFFLAAASFPGIREFSAFFGAAFDVWAPPSEFPIQAMINNSTRALNGLRKDGELSVSEQKAMVMTIGLAFQLPSGQAWKLYKAGEAAAEGDGDVMDVLRLRRPNDR